jgi:O-antigen/teichoic acid export membrane protein
MIEGDGHRRGAAWLSIGTVASGVLAYAFNALAARGLGPEQYGPVAVLWAAVFLVSVVLFRPVEQTLSRTISDRLARDEDAVPVVRSGLRLAAILWGVTLVASLVLWTPITDGLFNGATSLTAAFIAGVLGYALSYLARGCMGGLRWFSGYGALLLVDGVVRFGLALPLVIVASTPLAGLAVAGAAFAGALAPLALGGRRRASALRRPTPGAAFRVRDAGTFAAPLLLLAAADQVLVSGGPLLVVLEGGPDAHTAAGTVFAATMLVRAPVFLFQGFSAALLPSLTTFQAVGDGQGFRRAVARTTAVLVGFGAALTIGALALGPPAMRLLYGAGFSAGRLDLALLGVGVSCYLATSTFSQAAVAQGAQLRAGLLWGVSAATFVALQLTLGGSPLHRVSVAFACATAVGSALALALVARPGAAPPATGQETPSRRRMLDPAFSRGAGAGR